MNQRYVMTRLDSDNTLLRNSFNELAKETFGLDFEDWYQNGYWTDNYIPYSIIDENKVLANASVNIMSFDYLGIEKRYIQIGTVMTAKAYRNQGLSRILIEEILKDYKDKVDGIFLFANDSVLDFYPKFGFRKGPEYQYSKYVHSTKQDCMIPVSMKGKRDFKLLEEAILNSACNGAFQMKANIGLIMFYITKLMSDHVYYMDEQKAFVIAEIEDENLLLYDVFSPDVVDLNQIIEGFGKQIKTVTLGFTPLAEDGFTVLKATTENTTLFLFGQDFHEFEQKKIMFPLLSHA